MEKQKTQFKSYYTTIDGEFDTLQEAQQHYGWSKLYNSWVNINKVKKYQPLNLEKVVVKGSEPLLEYKFHPKFTDYCVDTDGNIYRYGEEIGFKEIKSHTHGKVGVNKSNSKGYATIQPYLDGKRYLQYHHRFVAETWVDNPDNKRCVNHLNEVKWDNRVENLEWVTYKENSTYNIKKLMGPKEVQHTWVLSFKGVKQCEGDKMNDIARKSGLRKNVVIYIAEMTRKTIGPNKSKYSDYELVKVPK